MNRLIVTGTKGMYAFIPIRTPACLAVLEMMYGVGTFILVISGVRLLKRKVTIHNCR